jgi:hypothetical protein
MDTHLHGQLWTPPYHKVSKIFIDEQPKTTPETMSCWICETTPQQENPDNLESHYQTAVLMATGVMSDAEARRKIGAMARRLQRVNERLAPIFQRRICIAQ